MVWRLFQVPSHAWQWSQTETFLAGMYAGRSNLGMSQSSNSRMVTAKLTSSTPLGRNETLRYCRDLMTASQADAAAAELHSALNALLSLNAIQPASNPWQSVRAVCIGTSVADLGEESESYIRSAVRRLLPASVQVRTFDFLLPRQQALLHKSSKCLVSPPGTCLQQYCYRPRLWNRWTPSGLRFSGRRG